MAKIFSCLHHDSDSLEGQAMSVFMCSAKFMLKTLKTCKVVVKNNMDFSFNVYVPQNIV